MNKEMFDFEGPQLTSVGHGKEPSLRYVLENYYQTCFDKKESSALAEKHIKQWLIDNKDRT